MTDRKGGTDVKVTDGLVNQIERWVKMIERWFCADIR